MTFSIIKIIILITLLAQHEINFGGLGVSFRCDKAVF
jgi:hypothetical protein